MAPPISQAEYAKAIELHCLSAGLTAVSGEQDGKPRILFEPGGVTVQLIDGDIVSNSTTARQALRLLISEMRESGKPAPVPAVRTAPSSGPLTPRDVVDYINPKATEAEAYLFAEFCRRKGADPMTKQVYMVIYEGQGGRQVNFIAGKEYFTEKAEAHPQFDGFHAGIMVRPKDGGPIERRIGTFWLPAEEVLLGGWAKVARKDRSAPFEAEVPLADYDTKKNLWARMPATMIRKVALVQALREAFPANFGGMYDRAEMDQA